jgi:hypothetical protein
VPGLVLHFVLSWVLELPFSDKSPCFFETCWLSSIYGQNGMLAYGILCHSNSYFTWGLILIR